MCHGWAANFVRFFLQESTHAYEGTWRTFAHRMRAAYN